MVQENIFSSWTAINQPLAGRYRRWRGRSV